ncbi:MAG: hypothetical protein CM15mP49_24140 [Actinomycetota bacterium]|nr:MAG: hypothetical protein CM15mP49_24140 [Actinomycetota bacterium]
MSDSTTTLTAGTFDEVVNASENPSLWTSGLNGAGRAK